MERGCRGVCACVSLAWIADQFAFAFRCVVLSRLSVQTGVTRYCYFALQVFLKRQRLASPAGLGRLQSFSVCVWRVMLPPIHKSTNGLPNERRGSGVGGGFLGDANRKQTIASGMPSPSRPGYLENQSNALLPVAASSSFSPGLDRMAERVHALERENEHFREELQHLRHFYSSNQQQHEDDQVLLFFRGEA